ncbi:Phosphatidylinositol 4,5-bisphosphate 5-phosphatase A [Armadillidium nasatum]|uniref:Phosphatidylinositol 4,5-bisphosphate 5-phosphatase A n=1 Tax=Armadillidium nasatum TaxID=96803 RepID=A0A5N5TJ49_9CRUS|nr:Phosphatidylinositol 4,5-bisphosphate 5-phosphatase A [Armadillidium nasatum]
MDTLRISCITWNIETSWPEQDLEALLGLGEENKSRSNTQFSDFLQEVRSQPQNVVMDALFEEPWTNAFREVLGPYGYVRITGERLQGIVTSIFVLRHHIPHLRNIHTAITRTGLGGFWGNKGAVSVRFSLYGCSICIVNSHLAAHDSGFNERCANYNTIIDETVFPVTPTSHILFHDYVFWLGDLNFRLSGEATAEFISKKIAENDLEWLLQRDELKKAQETEEAFGPLSEATIKFPPTYKYQRNSNNYDLVRRPAWTDRILHQVHVNAYENVRLNIDQLLYESNQDYGQSDHKPVCAKYAIKVFSHHYEKCVTFKPIKEWFIGCPNTIKYTLDADVETSPWDYVAVFKADFTSVHQYVTYSYVPQIENQTNSSEQQRVNRSFQMIFNDELVQLPGLYVLLFYSSKYSCYLGMSDPFPVHRET